MSAGKWRLAAHIEVEWLTETHPARCPNCGFTGAVQTFLDIDYRPPGAVHRFCWQICPDCTARFVDNQHCMDYGSDHLIAIGWHTYQVQVGAGLWPITAPLARLPRRARAGAGNRRRVDE